MNKFKIFTILSILAFAFVSCENKDLSDLIVDNGEDGSVLHPYKVNVSQFLEVDVNDRIFYEVKGVVYKDPYDQLHSIDITNVTDSVNAFQVNQNEYKDKDGNPIFKCPFEDLKRTDTVVIVGHRDHYDKKDLDQIADGFIKEIIKAPYGIGAKEMPYNVASVVRNNSTLETTEIYVEGYIVGACENGEFKFTKETNADDNLLLSDLSYSYKEILPIKLPEGNIRAQLNLKEHKDVYGVKVIVAGKVSSDVCGKKGFTEVTYVKIGEEEIK